MHARINGTFNTVAQKPNTVRPISGGNVIARELVWAGRDVFFKYIWLQNSSAPLTRSVDKWAVTDSHTSVGYRNRSEYEKRVITKTKTDRNKSDRDLVRISFSRVTL